MNSQNTATNCTPPTNYPVIRQKKAGFPRRRLSARPKAGLVPWGVVRAAQEASEAAPGLIILRRRGGVS